MLPRKVTFILSRTAGMTLGGCCRLQTSLQAFELKPTHEDVVDVHADSVEEYLQRLHEMTVTTTIQVQPL